jgi:hypothetical protein
MNDVVSSSLNSVQSGVFLPKVKELSCPISTTNKAIDPLASKEMPAVELQKREVQPKNKAIKLLPLVILSLLLAICGANRKFRNNFIFGIAQFVMYIVKLILDILKRIPESIWGSPDHIFEKARIFRLFLERIIAQVIEIASKNFTNVARN